MNRVAITIIICIVILAAFSFAGWASGGWSKVFGATPLEMPHGTLSKYEEHLIELDRDALEKAYHQQLLLLWNIWLKDDIGQTNHINNGLRIARRAYVHAAEKIEQRKAELDKKKQ